ncbi:hypothetical protein J6590_011274 [Homalodisca vitripennis]|nr:hypothetical protein J6590_011274 [Homalodisca vitripennis]
MTYLNQLPQRRGSSIDISSDEITVVNEWYNRGSTAHNRSRRYKHTGLCAPRPSYQRSRIGGRQLPCVVGAVHAESRWNRKPRFLNRNARSSVGGCVMSGGPCMTDRTASSLSRYVSANGLSPGA